MNTILIIPTANLHQKILIQALSNEKNIEYTELLRFAEYNLHEINGGKIVGEVILRYAQKRLEIYQQLSNHIELQMQCCNHLSRYYYELGDLKNALLFLEQSLALEEHYCITEYHDFIPLRINQCNLFWECGEWKKAINLTRELCIICQNQLDKNDHYTFNVKHNLGYYLLHFGKHSEAEDILWELVQQCQTLLHSPGVEEREKIRASSLYYLGELYLELNYIDNAKKCFQHAFNIHSRYFGEEHLFNGKISTKLADAFMQSKEPESAIFYRKKALSIYQNNLEGQSYQIANCMVHLALDYSIIAPNEELATLVFGEACSQYNTLQNDISINSLDDIIKLLHYRAQNAIQDEMIHLGLELLEEIMSLYNRILNSPHKLSYEYNLLAQIFEGLEMPDKAEYYLTLSKSCIT